MFGPGLQAERTVLAWRRTVIAVVINALVIFKFALTQGDGRWGSVGLAFAIVVSFVVAAAIARQLCMSQVARPVSSSSSVRLVAFACMAICATGLVTVIAR